MPRIHLSFTERRRRRLALKVDRLDLLGLEKRSTVTPFSAFSLAAGAFQGLAQVGLMQGSGNAEGGPVLPARRHSEPGPSPRRPVHRLADTQATCCRFASCPRQTEAAAVRRTLRIRQPRQGSRSRPTTN